MNKTLVTILLFAGLILFITSPFAGLASLMLVLLVSAFLWTSWTIIQILASGSDTKSDVPSKPKDDHLTEKG